MQNFPLMATASNTNNLVTIVAFTIIAAVVFLVVFFAVLNSVKNKRVMESSSYIKKVIETNRNYTFRDISKTYEVTTFHLNSKRAFENFNYIKKIGEFINENYSHFLRIVENIEYNTELLKKYKEELSNIPLTTDSELAKANKMSLKSYNAREKKLANKIIKKPIAAYSFRAYWEYTSPAGRNHYEYHCDFSYSEIKNIVGYRPNVAKNDYVKPVVQKTSPSTYSKPQTPQKVYTNDDIDDVE